MRFSYVDFVEKVCELGFIGSLGFGSDVIPEGLPNLCQYIGGGQWWTGDAELDPWVWKDRAAAERRLRYGAFADGRKGFISPGFYSIFRDAFHPAASIQERYEAGVLGRYEYQVWNLLEREGRPLGAHELRKMAGVKAGDGKGALDGAIANLHMTMDIVTSGVAEIRSKIGKPYGSSMAYDIAERWAPPDWVSRNPQMAREEALERIFGRAIEIGNGITAENVQKLFSRQMKVFQRYNIRREED